MKRFFALSMIALLALALTSAAAADEISDQLEKGLQLYKQGQLSQAMGEIQFALARIKQKKAEALGEIFPEPPSGWTGEKPQGASAGGGMLGGGISASRQYRDKGRGRVMIKVVTDSPLISSLAMILSNPMFLQGGKNGKLVRIQGHNAVLKDRGQRAELQALIDNKVLLRVSARRVDQAAEVVRRFADKVDLAKLKELTQ